MSKKQGDPAKPADSDRIAREAESRDAAEGGRWPSSFAEAREADEAAVIAGARENLGINALEARVAALEKIVKTLRR